MPPKRIQTFAEFYPFYLSQHAHPVCRILHFLGSLIIVLALPWIFWRQNWWYLLALPFIGYGFAWIGHFVFEKNRPATFTYPWYSFMGDWKMFSEILLGKRRFRETSTRPPT